MPARPVSGRSEVRGHLSEEEARAHVVKKILSKPQQIWISNEQLKEIQSQGKLFFRNLPLRGRVLSPGEVVILLTEINVVIEAYVLKVISGVERELKVTHSVEVARVDDSFSCGGLSI